MMRIGFDAKKAFFNRAGLGNFSRTLIRTLGESFPQYSYFLYSPKIKENGLEGFAKDLDTCSIRSVANGWGRFAPSLWRSFLGKTLEQDKIDLYHGLAHELPFNFHRIKTKGIVSMHDVIFLRYPHLYASLDRAILGVKYRYACQHADHIVAISEQTRQDLHSLLSVPLNRISVIYQSCNPIYYKVVRQAKREAIREKLKLPKEFLLSVGTIEERKNLLRTLQALSQLEGKLSIPLVVVGGERRSYVKRIRSFITSNKMEKQLVFLKGISNEDLAALYQMANAVVYPSLYEGFGLPVLEGLASRVPVITSKGGCMEEAGGLAAYYVNPKDVNSIAQGIETALTNRSLQEERIDIGWEHAQKFRMDHVGRQWIRLYERVLAEG